MPGLIVFKRRWSVGSDDLVVPGAFLLVIHLLFLAITLALPCFMDSNIKLFHLRLLLYHLIVFLLILGASIIIEIGICIISMRGSILDCENRLPINCWIHLKAVIMFLDILWLILGSIWFLYYYNNEPTTAITTEATIIQANTTEIIITEEATIIRRLSFNQFQRIYLGILISNWFLIFVTGIIIWCMFDAAGRSWVKMKKFQQSTAAARDSSETRINYNSGGAQRNWRQRKVIRAYENSWNHRCRVLFCCIGSTERNRDSFADIARLLSDFFRDLDVVPSDVVAGLVLLRKFQRFEREAIVQQRKYGIYEFLSGVPVTEQSRFMALNDPKNYEFLQTVIHYMYFAQGAYGWPMYVMVNHAYKLLPKLRCFYCCKNNLDETEIIQDNCCLCNYSALSQTLKERNNDFEIIYATYHVDVGETPFFVAIDYTRRKIVISIRGTLSMKDILTDLNAESEVLPLRPPKDDWLGHKGMVQAAIYIRKKLEDENLIEKARNRDLYRETNLYDLVLVGHSLGAGTAAILAVLMKSDYPTLQCFSYSPPGGLLSSPVAEYSKSFITSVVLGKDVVPRIGLYQMETLRADLINIIQRSTKPKWQIISSSIFCCGAKNKTLREISDVESNISLYRQNRDEARNNNTHPNDSSIALTLHQPLYPPGKIMHIVRRHQKTSDENKYGRRWKNMLKRNEPVYQIIWAEPEDFKEVLISPVMLQDHMPDQVLSALKKVMRSNGPRKPQRQSTRRLTISANANAVNASSSIMPTNLDEETNNNICIMSNMTNPSKTSIPDNNYQHIEETNNSTSPRRITLKQKTNTSIDIKAKNTLLIKSQDKDQPIIDKEIISSPISEILTSSSLSSLLSPSNSSTTSHSTNSILSFMQNNRKTDNYTFFNGSSTMKRCTKDLTQQSIEYSNKQTEHNKEKHRKTKITNEKDRSTCATILQTRCKLEEEDPYQSWNWKKQHRNNLQNNISPEELHYKWQSTIAPLASMETLSDISSISSLNVRVNCNDASELQRNWELKYFQEHMPNGGMMTSIMDGCETETPGHIFESQLHTPKAILRTPKFSENLSKCTEDNRCLDEYKKIDRIIVKHRQ